MKPGRLFKSERVSLERVFKFERSFKSERVSLERVFKFERLFKSERSEVPRVWEEDYKKKILDFFYPEHNLDLNPNHFKGEVI
jgi:hypothetical protein